MAFEPGYCGVSVGDITSWPYWRIMHSITQDSNLSHLMLILSFCLSGSFLSSLLTYGFCGIEQAYAPLINCSRSFSPRRRTACSMHLSSISSSDGIQAILMPLCASCSMPHWMSILFYRWGISFCLHFLVSWWSCTWRVDTLNKTSCRSTWVARRMSASAPSMPEGSQLCPCCLWLPVYCCTIAQIPLNECPLVMVGAKHRKHPLIPHGPGLHWKG